MSQESSQNQQTLFHIMQPTTQDTHDYQQPALLG